MRGEDGFNDRQAQAGAAFESGATRIDPVEAIKDTFLVGWGDLLPMVRDFRGGCVAVRSVFRHTAEPVTACLIALETRLVIAR